MNGDVSVRVEHLGRDFGGFRAVDDISFEIAAGRIWGFLGPNGSGKSTTIRMLCGVLEPSSGRAEVLGFDVAGDPEPIKLRIGYMTQGSSLWNDLTVDEHLRFYAGLFEMYGRARDRAIAEWTERVGLGDYRRQLAGALPGGVRKRLGLACALLHRPRMLFLDEPTSGVDPVSRRAFWDIIVELAEAGTTIMVTTHYLDEAEHCDELAFIYRGRIIAAGTPDAIKQAAGAGVTVEILSEHNVRWLEPVERLAMVRGVSLYGASLHVTVAAEADLPALRSALDALGTPPFSRIAPSLEDVFADLVHRAEAGSDTAA